MIEYQFSNLHNEIFLVISRLWSFVKFHQSANIFITNELMKIISL